MNRLKIYSLLSLRFSKCCFCPGKKITRCILGIYFRFILYRNDSKIDFMRTWIRIERTTGHRLGELPVPATAICMLFPKIKSPPREKRTKSGFRPLFAPRFAQYDRLNATTTPNIIISSPYLFFFTFNIEILILRRNTYFRLDIKRKKFLTWKNDSDIIPNLS